MTIKMTAPCRALVTQVKRRARWARWKARFRPYAERQRFIYDNTFRNEIDAVAFFLAQNTGEIPNFATPTTYSEKMRGQFLTHPNPLMSIAADKIAMRAYCDLFDLPIRPVPLIATFDSPAAMDAMVETARRLSGPLFHCRVDFMRHAGRLYLGEITLSPGGYYSPLTPPQLEKMRGDLFDLARLPDYLSQVRRIAAKLGWPTETSFGHYAPDDPRLATGGQ